jgi:hypothetical protein
LLRKIDFVFGIEFDLPDAEVPNFAKNGEPRVKFLLLDSGWLEL